MNGFELSSYKTSTMRSDLSTIYHPSLAPSLAGNVSSGNTIGYHQSPPVPIDKTTCIALVTNALKEAREKNREAELRGRGNNSPDLGAQQQFYQRSGVTIDLSHQKISNIPLEVIELIKDEIERSENRKTLITPNHNLRKTYSPLLPLRLCYEAQWWRIGPPEKHIAQIVRVR